MKESPILMSAPMVRATLREVDPKTQTRRVMSERHRWHFIEASGDFALCPYGQPGDRLWVRETWTWQGGMVDGTRPDFEYNQLYVKYHADGEKRTIIPTGVVKTPEAPPQRDGEVYSLRDAPDDFQYDGENTYVDRLSRWWQRKIPAIHMPRWASRITLEITEVRVQRLQEISESDAYDEGIDTLSEAYLAAEHASIGGAPGPAPAVCAYASLWDNINGPGSWEANPWVWAISFKRLTP